MLLLDFLGISSSVITLFILFFKHTDSGAKILSKFVIKKSGIDKKVQTNSDDIKVIKDLCLENQLSNLRMEIIFSIEHKRDILTVLDLFNKYKTLGGNWYIDTIVTEYKDKCFRKKKDHYKKEC